jgi:hypothetical protein
MRIVVYIVKVYPFEKSGNVKTPSQGLDIALKNASPLQKPKELRIIV